jgi:hypothetical protein
MTSIEAIITAARRYCKENHAYWANRYAKERSGEDFPVYTYSDQDYNLFPRYNALAAILGDIEMLTGKTWPELSVCRTILIQIGHSTPVISDNAIEANAIQDERNKYIDFIQKITPEELNLVEPLPYRRRLDDDEKQFVRQQLLGKWNYDGNYYDPLDKRCPTEFVFLSKEQITPADYQSVIGFIFEHVAPHLLEVTEDETDAEIACSEFNPDCDETIYCDKNYKWLIYGSHESTITFAGEELLVFIKQLFSGREHLFNQWPDKSYPYKYFPYDFPQ